MCISFCVCDFCLCECVALRGHRRLHIKRPVQFKVLTLTYKALNGEGASHVRNVLIPYSWGRLLPSGGQVLLHACCLGLGLGLATQLFCGSVHSVQWPSSGPTTAPPRSEIFKNIWRDISLRSPTVWLTVFPDCDTFNCLVKISIIGHFSVSRHLLLILMPFYLSLCSYIAQLYYQISVCFTSIFPGYGTYWFQYHSTAWVAYSPACCRYGAGNYIRTHKQSLSNQVSIHSWVERVRIQVKCLAQEHSATPR